MKKLLSTLLAVISLVVVSCSNGPLTPDSYVKQYEEFVDEISSQYVNYSDKDWDRQFERFKKFTGEWYERVEDRLGMTQKIKVTKLSYQASLVFAIKFGAEWFRALPDMGEDFIEAMSRFADEDVSGSYRSSYYDESVWDDFLREMESASEECVEVVEEAIEEFSF